MFSPRPRSPAEATRDRLSVQRAPRSRRTHSPRVRPLAGVRVDMVLSRRRGVHPRRTRCSLPAYSAPDARGDRADPSRSDDRSDAASVQHYETADDPGRARRVAAVLAPRPASPSRAHWSTLVFEDRHDPGPHAPRHPPRGRRHHPLLGAAAPGRAPGLTQGPTHPVGPSGIQSACLTALASGAPARTGRHYTDDAARSRHRVRFPARLRRGRRPSRHRLAGIRPLPRTHGSPVAPRTRPPCRDRR